MNRRKFIQALAAVPLALAIPGQASSPAVGIWEEDPRTPNELYVCINKYVKSPYGTMSRRSIQAWQDVLLLSTVNEHGQGELVRFSHSEWSGPNVGSLWRSIRSQIVSYKHPTAVWRRTPSYNSDFSGVSMKLAILDKDCS